MGYVEAKELAEQLTYRDKLRLAQLLIQLARKEEEEQKPQERAMPDASNPEIVQYVAERLLRLRPLRKGALLNSIGAMFQFQGGIPDAEKDAIVRELEKQGLLSIGENDRVVYPQ
jgi:hypothetical protein